MRTGLCFIFFAAVTVSLAQDVPKVGILPAQKNIQRDLGSTGFFTCKVNASQPNDMIGDVVWIDPRGEEVPAERSSPGTSSPRIYSTAKLSNEGDKSLELFINNITDGDSGDYTCKVQYGDQEITQTFRLDVFMSIRWVDAPLVQNPEAGTRATIMCKVKARPRAIVEWLNSNGDFVQKTDRYTPLDEGLLHIENVSPEDDGEFLCRAKVPSAGKMKVRRIKVEVHSRPEITLPESGSTTTVVETEAGSIRCEAAGKPEPERRWYGPAGTDAALVPGMTVNADGTLIIRPASRQMAGQYRCVANNSVAEAESTVSLVVHYGPEVVSYENVTSIESESAKLVCRVSGFPLPSVAFRRDGTDITDEENVISDDDRLLVRQFQEGDEQVGELTIRDLTRGDAGLYECVASGTESQRSVTPALLTVQYPPVLSAPDSVEVLGWAGRPTELRCRADAEPAAVISWTFEGRSVEDVPQMQQKQDGDTSVLTVTPTDAGSYGAYTCSASNFLHSGTLDFTLDQAETPGVVVGVTAEDVTANSVEFSIPEPDSDGGLPVEVYLVQYVPLGRPWEEATGAEWPAEGPFLLHEHLEPKQTYRFRFAAKNAVGAGAWSEELQQLMPKIDVPRPPLLISVSGEPVAEELGPEVVIQSDTSHSYEAHWNASKDNGAEVDFYEVTIHKMIFNKNVWREVLATKRASVVNMPGPLTFRLTNLNADAFYRLQLRAHNQVGYSERTEVIIHTAESGETPTSEMTAPKRSSSLVVGVVIAVLLALVVLCDLACYAVNSRGITHMLCSRARGTANGAKLAEEAASEKEPLQENGNGNKSSPPPPEVNGERDAGDPDEELKFDKAQLDAAKDSAV